EVFAKLKVWREKYCPKEKQSATLLPRSFT
ncbi:unnamed protein product, partial [marine sediment metagenome]